MNFDPYHASERTEQLSHAIHLCHELRDTLARIGPSRFTLSADYLSEDEYEKIRRAHELEMTLQRRFQDTNERRNVALSPISRLPDDVLRLIFGWAQTGWVVDHLAYKIGYLPSCRLPREYRMHIALSQVSRRWRSISLGTASYWARAHFKHPKFLMDEAPPLGSPEGVHPWYRDRDVLDKESLSAFSRSNMAPMTITVELGAQPGLSRLLDEYTRLCSDRVADLRLFVQKGADRITADLSNAIIHCISITPGTLRRLQIRLPDEPDPAGGTPSAVMESIMSISLPRLVELQMEAVVLPLTANLGSPALLHCRSLRLLLNEETPGMIKGLLSLLKCTPVLEELHVIHDVVCSVARMVEPSALDALRLPNLHLLHVEFANVVRARLLSMLSAPNLEVLALRSYHELNEGAPAWEDAVTLVEASGQSTLGGLVSLRALYLSTWKSGKTVELLRHLPELERLELVFHAWCENPEEEMEYTELISALSPPHCSSDSWTEPGPPGQAHDAGLYHDNPVLLPKLKVFTSVLLAKPVHLRLLTRMAASRSAAGFRLVRIAIGNWPEHTPWTNAETESMAITSREQLELERALAREVDRLECAAYKWEWVDGGRWSYLGKGYPSVRIPQGWRPWSHRDWLTSTIWG